MKRLLTGARKLTVYRAVLIALMAMIPVIGGWQLVQSQDPAPENKEGKTAAVLIVPGSTVNAGEVIFKADADHDGMSDEEEAANGTDPNDPSDADEDSDGDGLTNGDEVAGGSGVNNADSDGDGVSDGEEVRLGFNPGDPSSVPPAGVTLTGLQVTANPTALVINTLLGQQPVQLTVTGLLSDASTVDLTSAANTVYQSLNTSVALVSNTGSVAGVSPGIATINVTNGSLSLQTTFNVFSFVPGLMSFIQLAGQANNVDVSGDFAYVAVGSSGVQVVNVSNRRAPQIIATLDTSGIANDIRVVGNLAYVADGSAGLKIIDVTNPASPFLRGTIDTPGDARDVVVYGARAYVADGTTGLQIINVSNPAAPAIVRTVDTPGTAFGVDVAGNTAVVMDRTSTAGVRIIDITNEAGAQIVGTLTMPGNLEDVVTRDSLAYCAGANNGLFIVDFSAPSLPVLRGQHTSNETGFFTPTDVALTGNFVLAAETRFTNAVPVDDISDPSDPRYRGALDYTNTGTFDGTGIALDPLYVYTTSTGFPSSRLYIGQYQAAGDTAGIPPTVSVTAPADGSTVEEGNIISLTATAADDFSVAGVQFNANGSAVGPMTQAPYSFNYTVPLGVTSVTLTATAFDYAGNSTTSAPITINVSLDPPPVISITDPAEGTVLVEGRLVNLKSSATDDDGISRVTFTVNGVAGAPDTIAPYEYGFTIPLGVTTLSVEARAVDNIGNSATAQRVFNVGPNPLPVVMITEPAEGTELVEGQFIKVKSSATDEDGISQVTFSVNGVVGATVTIPPYNYGFNVPLGVTTVSVEARAVDTVGKFATAQRVFNVNPDPKTTVVGQVLDKLGQPLSNVTVRVFGEYSTVTGADGSFTLGNVPSARGDVQAIATTSVNTEPYSGASARVPPVPAGTTNVGLITLRPVGQIAFVRRPGDGGFSNSEIYLMDPNGQNQTRLTFNTFREHTPVFSPDGLKIAFNRDNSCGDNVYVMNADGSNQISISPGDNFVWSPDSRKLAYVFNGSIYISNADGSGKRLLAPLGAGYFYPVTWSPDGTKLAYVGLAGVNQHDIYTINADGSNNQRLTNSLAQKYEVTWSPDGAWIAFVQRDSGARYNVFAVHPDGSGLVQLTTEDIYYWDLVWMPDSNKLACIFEGDFGSSIYLLDLNGGAPARVTNNGFAYDWGPAPSGDGAKIAYASDEGLYIVNSDGSEQLQLSETDWDPNFRPEVIPVVDPGTSVTGRVVDSTNQPVPSATIKLFGQTVGTSAVDGTFSITGVSTLKGNLSVITSAASGGRVDSGFSAANVPVPNGLTQVGDVRIAQKIAFISERDGNPEIYLMDADGSNQVRVTSTDEDESRPSLSPDRTKIAFATNQDGHDEIYFMNLDGSNPFRVSYLQFNCVGDFDPEWSPDGTKILFTGRNTSSSNPDIYVVNSDATNLQRLTTSTALDHMPSWLPDGSRIMFVSRRDNSFGEIYVMNADGSNQTRLSNNSISEREPTSSPDGTKIAYSSFRDGRDSIFVINVDGSNEVRVTTDAASNDYPTWSHDGTRILYSSNGDGNYELYVINIDGTNRVRLTTNTFDDLQPDW